MNIVQWKVWLALDAQQTAAQQKENKNNKQQTDIKVTQKPTKFYDNHNNQEKKITRYTKSLKSKPSLQENQSEDLPVAGQEHEKVEREANKPNWAAVLFGRRSISNYRDS